MSEDGRRRGAPDAWNEQTVLRHKLIGSQLGDYRVEAQLGEGGMGIVYRGTQVMLGKGVAIKVLKAELLDDEKQLARLLEEARTVAAIRHPNIVDVASYGLTNDGQPYFVMELLEGEPLDVVVDRRGALPLREVFDIMDQVLGALSAAHAAGVIHRDLKPSNIFLQRLSDGTRFVKLLDFGLAKKLDAKDPQANRPSMQLIGTPEYMSPEQIRGEALGPGTDLYAVGVTLYELLTGQPPFLANSAMDVLMRAMNEAPKAPSVVERSVPEALDELVLRLLDKHPHKRPPTAAAVRAALARLRRDVGQAETKPRTDKYGAFAPARPAPRLSVEETAAIDLKARPDKPGAVVVGTRPTVPQNEVPTGEVGLREHPATTRPDDDSGPGQPKSAAQTHPGDTGPGDTGPGDTGPGDSRPGDSGPGDSGNGDSNPSLPTEAVSLAHLETEADLRAVADSATSLAPARSEQTRITSRGLPTIERLVPLIGLAIGATAVVTLITWVALRERHLEEDEYRPTKVSAQRPTPPKVEPPVEAPAAPPPRPDEAPPTEPVPGPAAPVAAEPPSSPPPLPAPAPVTPPAGSAPTKASAAVRPPPPERPAATADTPVKPPPAPVAKALVRPKPGGLAEAARPTASGPTASRLKAEQRIADLTQRAPTLSAPLKRTFDKIREGALAAGVSDEQLWHEVKAMEQLFVTPH